MSCKFKGTLAEWNLATRITSWESAYAYDGGASTTFIPATYIENTYTQSNPMGALYFKDTINTYGSNTISVAQQDVRVGFIDDSIYFNDCDMDKLVGDLTAGFHFANTKARIHNKGPNERRRRLVDENHKLENSNATSGGAIMFADDGSDVFVDECYLQLNTGYRGVFYARDSSIEVDDSAFFSNTGTLGGAICSENSYYKITDSTVTYNTA